MTECVRRTLDDRLHGAHTIAEVRQVLIDAREETIRELAELQAQIEAHSFATHEDRRAYTIALSAGWTPDELRQLGFSTPGR